MVCLNLFSYCSDLFTCQYKIIILLLYVGANQVFFIIISVVMFRKNFSM